LGEARGDVTFLACSIGVAFLSCWLVPGARNRYFSPVFPCVAPLIGLVVERCAAAASQTAWATVCRHWLRGLAAIMPAAAIWILATTLAGWGAARGGQPLWFACAYAVAAAALGVLVWIAAGHARYRLAVLAWPHSSGSVGPVR
jgi:hypothetical protein